MNVSLRAGALLILLTSAVAEECSERHIWETKTCLRSYYAGFGIDASKTLPEFLEFEKHLSDIVSVFKAAGIHQLCLSERALEGCLGNLFNETTCAYPTAFEKMFGIDKIAATMYATDIRARSFECTQEDFLIKHLQCMFDVKKKHSDDIVTCQKDLVKEIKEGTMICKAFVNFIGCFQKVYRTECGNDIDKFLCETMEVTLLFNYPKCKSSFPKC